MSSIIEFISQFRSEEIERVIKLERAICQPECFKVRLKSERVKTFLFLCFKFPFLRLPCDRLLHLRISKREKKSKLGNLEMLPSW